MKDFKELDKREASIVEEDIRKEWKKIDILKKSIDLREKAKDFVFYDGPIYANAKPGLHHVFAKTIKDSFCKYKTMQGFKVLRKIGLDTHGLPIEVNVEKKLGFKNKSDIEKFGIENFCKECNLETDSNIEEVRKVTDIMGQFIDQDNPYITCTNDYIESEWWLIKQIFDKGLIYHGNKVLPYCYRCGTELSQNEVSQGYQNDTVNTVIVPFKLVDEDAYLLVWTTTPWTLIDNVALCVNENFNYLKVKYFDDYVIVEESLIDKVLDNEYTIIEKLTGKDLKGKKYHQLLEFNKVEGKAFEVLTDNYVTNESGTGIVHLAPAYGEDDNRVCRKNGISFVQSVNKDGCYTTGPWEGACVTDKDLEIEIIKYLKENDKLFKKIKMTHEYPHCWRCKSPLIYYAKPAWYIRTTDYKDEIIKANKGINWYPNYVGEKRFSNWLSHMVDWGISRNRYWGCPMPLWTCDCGHIECIGSLKELKEKIIEDIDVNNIELHRPYVDNLHIKCPKCGESMERVKDVMDVWFDSGAMPYAQMHYPFENKDKFDRLFPADFIAEGIDQTRGWFNSLLCISTIVSNRSSFKNVVVNDLMLDAHGKKMSKSVGNIINPIDIMIKYGADPVRFYMMYTSPVWTPLKFNEEGIKEVYSKFFNPLKNTYSFFAMYANTDNIDINDCNIPVFDREEIDKWIISKYNKLVKDLTNAYEAYDLNIVANKLAEFVSDDLSNWYIRRNRKRFWASNLDNSKKAVYITTYEILEGLTRLAAPIVPYITEEIYQKLTGKESVHLSDFPVCDDTLIDNYIESRMDLVRSLISIGRYVREEAKIKVRQPLSCALTSFENKKLIEDLVPLIKEELNLKEVKFIENINDYMNISLKPNFKEVGKIFGPAIKEFASKLENLSKDDINKLQNDESIVMNINNKDEVITKDMVDIRISSKEGFNVGMENNNFIILDTTLTDELICEGLSREFVSKIQNIRKEEDFVITDRINIYYNGDKEIDEAINNTLEYIKKETLAIVIEKTDNLFDKYNINNHDVYIKIEKNNG